MKAQNTDINVRQFLERLSSASPTPGGGGVAALSGAMAASLVLMVGNLTRGKRKFASHQAKIESIMDSAKRSREQLMMLIERDAEAYQAVISCYRLSKDTTEEKQERRERIQTALQNASEVPYRTAETCYEVLKLNEALVEIGNPNAISDVAVSAHLAEAALHSALCNVDINCNLITNKDYADLYLAKKKELATQAAKIKDEIITAVEMVLEQ